MERPRIKEITAGLTLAVVTALGSCATQPPETQNAGIVYEVNSTGDGGDMNLSDGVCQTDTGDCTLRAAIEESNAQPGTQDIHFAITSKPDYQIDGFNGFTIKPVSSLPPIIDKVIIDGATQPGSRRNTAPAPQPFTGRHLVEIDGSNAGPVGGLVEFLGGSKGSVLSDMVINQSRGNGIVVGDDNISFLGDYIGVEPDGMSAAPNHGAGVTSHGVASHIRLGGLRPRDRGIMSGNMDSAAYPTCAWDIKGLYVGLGADGETPIPNATVSEAGAFSIDNCAGTIVGGIEPEAMVVVSGNASHGVAPSNSPGTIIEGDRIGTDWTGTKAVPNLVGITIDGDQTGSVIKDTLTSGNALAGILSGSKGKLRVIQNIVGLDVSGEQPLPNGAGILVADDSIIGGDETEGNTAAGNREFNISVQGIIGPARGAVVSANKVGTDKHGNVRPEITDAQGEGIRLSGDVQDVLIGHSDTVPFSRPNRIAGTRGAGIAVRQLSVVGFDIPLPARIAILGNEIFDNQPGGTVPGAAGQGIDYSRAFYNTMTFPADFQADYDSEVGITPNTYPEQPGFINSPVLLNAQQQGNDLSLGFNLNASGSPIGNYRVEFYANDTSDGEGQTYLGATTVMSGDGQVAHITLPSGIDLTDKHITATTTAVDDTSPYGFGSTSEFSPFI